MKLSRDAFSELVRQALEGIPEGFRPYLEGVAVDVEDEPDEATCRERTSRTRPPVASWACPTAARCSAFTGERL